MWISRSRTEGVSRYLGPLFVVALMLVPLRAPVPAQNPVPPELLSAIVKVSAEIPPDARSAQFLGTRREGSGILIDDEGLILTIGYLIMESQGSTVSLPDGSSVPATFVAYDHDSGFGLLRATKPLNIKPIEIGESAKVKPRDPVMVASNGGSDFAIGAYVVSRREFAGGWEYLLSDAIFTSPPHPNFGGAALIDVQGKLIGVGSLIVPDAGVPEQTVPGNMFVPIDTLKPILADLLASGRSSENPRPWLGINTDEIRGRLFVSRVSAGGPSHKAGIVEGDMILAVKGEPVSGLSDFYRKVWALGKAGVEVPLTILHGIEPVERTVFSIDRYSWLKKSGGSF